MGSIDAACIAGFLCRLCSEMHRTVIHIYSDQGHRHSLASKINAYLPVTITPNDPLPKTICKTCMKRVETHHELMIKIQKHRDVFLNSASPRIELVRLEEMVAAGATTTNFFGNRSQTNRTSTNNDDMDTNVIDENDNTNSSTEENSRNDNNSSSNSDNRNNSSNHPQ